MKRIIFLLFPISMFLYASECQSPSVSLTPWTGGCGNFVVFNGNCSDEGKVVNISSEKAVLKHIETICTGGAWSAGVEFILDPNTNDEVYSKTHISHKNDCGDTISLRTKAKLR